MYPAGRCGGRGQRWPLRACAELTPPPQCNSTGGDCFYRAYSSGVKAVRAWYLFHYVSILASLPTDHQDGPHGHGNHFVFSCRYDSRDCQAR